MKAKGQGHTDAMNVCGTLSHGETLMCQIWCDYVKGQNIVVRTQNYDKNI